jgi:hypothetical protein
LLIVSTAIVLFLAGSVLGHREAVDEEELARKVVVNQESNQANQDDEFLENMRVGPIGPEVHTGPKDFAYCNLSQKI